MAKLNKVVCKIIKEILMERIPHHASIAHRIRENDPTLPSHFDRPAEWHETMLEACYMQLEDLLHGHNVYNGYREYVDSASSYKLRWYYVSFLRYPDVTQPLAGQQLEIEQ